MVFVHILVGLLIGIIEIFYLSQILVPLFYFIPKSIGLVIRGDLRPYAIIRSLIVPIIYIAIPFLIGYFFPSIVDTAVFKFLNDPVTNIISNIFVLGLIYRIAFTKNGRADAKQDFWNTMHHYLNHTSRSNHLLMLKQYGEGLKYYDSKNYKSAIFYFNLAIASILKLPQTEENNELLKELLFNKGCAYDDLKEYEEAVDAYTKAIAIGLENASIFVNRGLANYELKNFHDAMDDYNEALEIDPKSNTAYFGRGNTKYQIGDKESACLDWYTAGELGLPLAYDMIKKFCNQ